MLRIFTSKKIQRLRPGLNPQTWVPEASMLTTRPRKPSTYLCNLAGPDYELPWTWHNSIETCSSGMVNSQLIVNLLVHYTKKYVRSLLFLEVTQRRWAIISRRFGTGPETSTNNYQSTPRNIPEERRSHLHLTGSLISRVRRYGWYVWVAVRRHRTNWWHLDAVCLNCRNKAYPVNVSVIGTEFYTYWRL